MKSKVRICNPEPYNVRTYLFQIEKSGYESISKLHISGLK